MQELEKYLQEAMNHTKFYSTHSDHVSPEKLRTFYEQQDSTCKHLCSIFEVKCHEDIFNILVGYLTEKLKNYVNEESNLVGYGADHVAGCIGPRKIKDIALLVIRAAALLTPVKAAKIFSSWLEEQSLQYKISVLLNGVSLEKPLFIDNSIEVNKVPELKNQKVPMNLISFSQSQYLSDIVLSIDIKMSPAFYKRQNDNPFEKVRHKWIGGEFYRQPTIYSFCEALSLSCNHYIHPGCAWPNGDIIAFISGSFWQTTNSSEVFTDKPMSQEQLNKALEVYNKRHNNKRLKPFLDVSIRRWLNSKRYTSTLTDKFIELRVALEALYLNDCKHELRYRLATQGALYLGENLEKRKEYYNTLKNAYDIASIAIHGQDVNEKKHIKLLENAQNLCRKGILKMLQQGQRPDWEKIILGEKSS